MKLPARGLASSGRRSQSVCFLATEGAKRASKKGGGRKFRDSVFTCLASLSSREGASSWRIHT